MSALKCKLNFKPLVRHIRPTFPESVELRAELDRDGTLRMPLGVKWTVMVPVEVMQAMGLQVCVTNPDGTVMDPTRYGIMLRERLARALAPYIDGEATIK